MSHAGSLDRYTYSGTVEGLALLAPCIPVLASHSDGIQNGESILLDRRRPLMSDQSVTAAPYLSQTSTSACMKGGRGEGEAYQPP